jgi:hypothetical protein
MRDFIATDTQRYQKLVSLPENDILRIVSLSESERDSELDKLIEKDVTQIKTLCVTKQVRYDSESYLEYCEDEGEYPTHEGFFQYAKDFVVNDFGISPTGLNYQFVDDDE